METSASKTLTDAYTAAVAAAATPGRQRVPRARWKRRPSVQECVALIRTMVEHANRMRREEAQLGKKRVGSDVGSLTRTYQESIAITMLPHLFARVQMLTRGRATAAQGEWLAGGLRVYANALLRQAELLRREAHARLEELEDLAATKAGRRRESTGRVNRESE